MHGLACRGSPGRGRNCSFAVREGGVLVSQSLPSQPCLPLVHFTKYLFFFILPRLCEPPPLWTTSTWTLETQQSHAATGSVTNSGMEPWACVACPALPCLPCPPPSSCACACVLERPSIRGSRGGPAPVVVPTSISPPPFATRRQGHFPILNAAAQPGRSQGKALRRPRPSVGRHAPSLLPWVKRSNERRAARRKRAGSFIPHHPSPASSVSSVSCRRADHQQVVSPFLFIILVFHLLHYSALLLSSPRCCTLTPVRAAASVISSLPSRQEGRRRRAAANPARRVCGPA